MAYDDVVMKRAARNIILHMYDDRGMDLIAAQPADLRVIYGEHKSWILDDDRKQIEATLR